MECLLASAEPPEEVFRSDESGVTWSSCACGRAVSKQPVSMLSARMHSFQETAAGTGS